MDLNPFICKCPVDACCHQFKNWWPPLFFFPVEGKKNANQVPPRAPKRQSKGCLFFCQSILAKTVNPPGIPNWKESQGLFCFLQAILIYSQLFSSIFVDPVGDRAGVAGLVAVRRMDEHSTRRICQNKNLTILDLNVKMHILFQSCRTDKGVGLPEAGELSRHWRRLSNESGTIVPPHAVMRLWIT